MFLQNYLHSACLHKSVHSSGRVHARKLQASDRQLSLRLALLVKSATLLCVFSHESMGSQYPSYRISFIQPAMYAYIKFYVVENRVLQYFLYVIYLMDYLIPSRTTYYLCSHNQQWQAHCELGTSRLLQRKIVVWPP